MSDVTTTTAPISEPVNTPTIDSDVQEGQGTTQGTNVDSKGTTGPQKGTRTFEEWLADQPESKGDKPESESKEINTPQETKPVEATKPATHKVKINGEEKEVSTEELVKHYQLAESADKKFKDASQLHKEAETKYREAEEFIKLLKDNPGEVLGKVGASKEAFEQWYYKTHIEPELLTPEQRALRAAEEKYNQTQSELEQYKAREKQAQDERDRQELEIRTAQRKAELGAEVSKSLSAAGIPESDWSVARTIDYMRVAIGNGFTNVQPSDVAEFVKQDWDNIQVNQLRSMTPEQLAQALGEEKLAAFRKSEADKYKNNKFNNKAPEGKVRETKKESKPKYKSVYDMLD